MKHITQARAWRWLSHRLIAACCLASFGAGAQTLPPAMSLSDLVAQVRLKNKDILSKRVDTSIAATGLDRAAAAFQPVATLSATDGRNRQPSTFEEKLSRGGTDTDPFYLRDGQDYTAAISQLLPTGAKLEAKSTLSRFITNINQKDGRPDGAKDNRAFWGLSVTQPLAKDAGLEVTRARGLVAELELAAAEHTQEETESSVVAEAALAYFDLVLMQHRVAAAQEKIEMGQALLAQAQDQARQGRLAATEIWEVENSLSRFRAAMSEAVQTQRERLNRLNNLLMTTADHSGSAWRAADPLPEVQASQVAAAQALGLALRARNDLKLQKKLLEREGVQLVYAKNQALPRIDLVASYGRNGLAYSFPRAFNDSAMAENPTWSVGLQMQIPLGENRQGRADVAAAQLRRENALLNLKALEVQIANDIDTSLNMTASAVERWKYWQGVSQREQQQLVLERQRFAAGRSEMRDILMREERAINARLMLLEQQLSFAKAQIILESAQGTLLQRWPS